MSPQRWIWNGKSRGRRAEDSRGRLRCSIQKQHPQITFGSRKQVPKACLRRLIEICCIWTRGDSLRRNEHSPQMAWRYPGQRDRLTCRQPLASLGKPGTRNYRLLCLRRQRLSARCPCSADETFPHRADADFIPLALGLERFERKRKVQAHSRFCLPTRVGTGCWLIPPTSLRQSVVTGGFFELWMSSNF